MTPQSTSPLVLSLLSLTHHLSHNPTSSIPFHRRHILLLRRRSLLLSFVLSDLLPPLSPSLLLCLSEILSLLHHSYSLLLLLSRCSLSRLALLFPSNSHSLRRLSHDLSSLLDLLPLDDDHSLPPDSLDFLRLLRREPSEEASDPDEENLRSEIFSMVTDIEREVIPSKSQLECLFNRLGVSDAETCKNEIVKLEGEIRDAGDGEAPMLVALLGLVRYAKCVLFGASTPRSYGSSRCFSFPDVPDDFRCPITLELMRDPVIVATGQTYDRASIQHWIQSGHATCPKTAKMLSHLRLVPNKALRNLIFNWCRERGVAFDAEQVVSDGEAGKGSAGLSSNKAAMEVARMTVLFLVQKLKSPVGTEDLNRIVYELRQLSKTGSENRAFIAEAGAIPVLIPLLGSDDSSLQVNAVTALLNLSILEDNKKRILKAAGGLERIVAVLRTGINWHARENAAATLLSLSSLHSVYRKRIGKEPGVAEGLAELVASGPVTSKRDGLITILNLAGVRENIGRLIEGGIVPVVLEALAISDVAEMAVAVLAAVAKRGGAEVLGKTEGFMEKLVGVLRQGNDSARESAVAALVSVCRNGGNGPVEKLSGIQGIEWVIWGMMGSASARARRKAAALGRICRRWAARQEMDRTVAASQEVDQTAALSSFSALTLAES